MSNPHSRFTLAANDGDAPCFAGTDIPVTALIDHLDSGGSPEAFLEAHPGLPAEVLFGVLAAGLRGLLSGRGRPRQASLLPQTDGAGTIVNTDELSADQVIGHSAVCPACKALVFKTWPEGWDAHAAHRCTGLTARGPEPRKREYKTRFAHLFR